jgi:hypothetical protein
VWIHSFFPIAVAHLLAKAHADVGLAQFNELQRVIHEAKRKGEKANFLLLLKHGAPAAMSMGLALELFLKTLHLQHFNRHPNTHDLVALWRNLPGQTREIRTRSYVSHYARSHPFEVTYFTMAAAENASVLPDAQRPQLATFDAAVAHLRDVFVVWRYLHEKFQLPQVTGIDFSALIAAIESVSEAVASFPGDTRITIGQ